MFPEYLRIGDPCHFSNTLQQFYTIDFILLVVVADKKLLQHSHGKLRELLIAHIYKAIYSAHNISGPDVQNCINYLRLIRESSNSQHIQVFSSLNTSSPDTELSVE